MSDTVCVFIESYWFEIRILRWNPAIEEQAFDRVHRIGQTKPVTIHRIMIKNSIELKILKLQEKKRQTAYDALDHKNNNNNNNGNRNNGKKESANLNVNDLMSLFGYNVIKTVKKNQRRKHFR